MNGITRCVNKGEGAYHTLETPLRQRLANRTTLKAAMVQEPNTVSDCYRAPNKVLCGDLQKVTDH